MVSLQEITDEFDKLLEEKGILDTKCGHTVLTLTGANEMTGRVKGFMDDHYKLTLKLVGDNKKLLGEAKKYTDFAKGKDWDSMDYNEKLEKIYGTQFVDFPSSMTNEQVRKALDFQNSVKKFNTDFEKGNKSLEKAIGNWGKVAVDKLDTSLTRDERDEVHFLTNEQASMLRDHKNVMWHTPVNEAWSWNNNRKSNYMNTIDKGIGQLNSIRKNTK